MFIGPQWGRLFSDRAIQFTMTPVRVNLRVIILTSSVILPQLTRRGPAASKAAQALLTASANLSNATTGRLERFPEPDLPPFCHR
jgi:hypothetical protein